MNNNNLNNSVATLLNKHSVEDILFVLYSKIDEQLRKDDRDNDKLQQQVNALDLACEMLDDSDKELWLNRMYAM